MNKKWRVNKKFPEKFKRRFPEYSEIVYQLLYERGIKTQLEVDEFFNPDYDQDLHDPFLMKDMDKAVKRIFEALEGEEKITVYGDYDADGITASALMIGILEKLKGWKGVSKGISTDVYLPDREKEGYGMNKKALEKIAENGTRLIITVDCGISSCENTEEAKKLGMDVIITDHHSIPEKIPQAIAVLDPKQKDCSYPFKELAGVGVAFKLAQALCQTLKKEMKTGKGIGNNKTETEINRLTIKIEAAQKWLLDLVALGTVADCVDLIGENRTLVKYGLLVLKKTRRLGIKSLIQGVSSGNGNNSNKSSLIKKRLKIDTYAIGYILAPRLNAAGRMDHANTAYQLLVTKSEEEAEALIFKLESNNRERQKITEEIIGQVKKNVSARYPDKKLPKIILESDKNWKVGVAGLAAGRLTDYFGRPVIILNQRDEVSVGSGRSVPQFNLIDAISACKELLIQYGGHSQAAGLKIENANLEKFYQKISKIADNQLGGEDLIPVILVSKELSPQDINWDLCDQIAKFQPFGEGNKKPLFSVKGLEVIDIRGVGIAGDKGYSKHLRMNLKANYNETKYFKAICFNQGKMIKEIKAGSLVDLVFSLEINEWNGNRELQLNVTDIRIESP